MTRLDILRHPARGAGRCMLLATLLSVAACEGDNLFQTFPSGSGSQAGGPAPTVDIQAPTSKQRTAVRDSVLVRVQVRSQPGLRELELRGFAVRGSARLGTETLVERFLPKRVEFDTTATVRDTTIVRYLLPAADTLPDDSVLIVASAKDARGNVRADTVSIILGGPRVQLLSPVAGSHVQAGSQIRVRVAVSSPSDRVGEVTIRADSSFAHETTLRLEPPRSALDTVVLIDVPETASGTVRLRAVARTITNDSAVTPALDVQVRPATADRLPPSVSFTVQAQGRIERDDSITISVQASDSNRVSMVGVSLRPTRRLSTHTETLTPVSLSAEGERATFRITPEDLGFPQQSDTSTLRVEVTAFARDAAGNCGAATVPGTPLSETCSVTTSGTFAARSGARYDMVVVLGTTVALQDTTDVIADIASNGRQVFLSNQSRNRLEVFDVGGRSITSTISVGSRPWGLAFGPGNDTLYVANSGGTNMSVVSPTSLSEVRRIHTPNIKLFDVAYAVQRVPHPDTTRRDSVSAAFPTSVTRYDYSDRPQFIGVTQNQSLVYSTRPTRSAPDGTLRILRKAQNRLDMIVAYAEERVEGKVVVANADSAFLVVSKPYNFLRVCPRARFSGDEALCFTQSVDSVEAILRSQGYDTRFYYNLNIQEIGLSDTTFVAVSGDHGTVAFGEGARENARVIVVREQAGAGAGDPTVKSGEIRDIVGNTAERLIGLALNQNGSLGVARGSEAFYFDGDLRLQGVADTGTQSGGADMDPGNTGRGVSYVSGRTSDGLAYIDVIDTFTFRSRGRIFMRDPVTGPLVAVSTAWGTMIYAVTAKGVVQLRVP